MIESLQRAGRYQVERVVGIAADRKLGVHATLGIQYVTAGIGGLR
jgi:hypothetical protein